MTGEAIGSGNVLQPDVRLALDMRGVIKEVSHSDAIPEADLDEWIGRAWVDTVSEPGCEKVRRMLDDARECGVSGFREINQQLPSGEELPIQYTTVLVGGEGLIAVGKSLQACCRTPESSECRSTGDGAGLLAPQRG